MKRFVRLRAVEGHVVPDPRQPLRGINYNGQQRMVGRRELSRSDLQELAKKHHCTIRELPWEMRYVAQHPDGQPIEMDFELDDTVKKLVRNGEVHVVGYVEASHHKHAKAKFDGDDKTEPNEAHRISRRGRTKLRKIEHGVTYDLKTGSKHVVEDAQDAQAQTVDDGPVVAQDHESNFGVPDVNEASLAIEELSTPDHDHGESDFADEEAD